MSRCIGAPHLRHAQDAPVRLIPYELAFPHSHIDMIEVCGRCGAYHKADAGFNLRLMSDAEIFQSRMEAEQAANITDTIREDFFKKTGAIGVTVSQPYNRKPNG